MASEVQAGISHRMARWLAATPVADDVAPELFCSGRLLVRSRRQAATTLARLGAHAALMRSDGGGGSPARRWANAHVVQRSGELRRVERLHEKPSYRGDLPESGLSRGFGEQH